MNTSYEQDVVAWANEQAGFIRAGLLDKLDLVHIAEEIEDVGKSEKRELASRMAVLLAHLLKWQFQPELRETGSSWIQTITEQRIRIAVALKTTPSLKPVLEDEDWQIEWWLDARSQARKETGIPSFPMACPWTMSDVLIEGWLPPSLSSGT